jgi:arabinogalactan endo-1,4-beta-galactosidase
MFSAGAVFHILGKIMYAFWDENIVMLQHSTLDI